MNRVLQVVAEQVQEAVTEVEETPIEGDDETETEAEQGAADASVVVSGTLDDTRAETPLPLRTASEQDNAVAGAGPPKETGAMSASSSLEFSESADLTGVGSISATAPSRNVYAGREGYETSGLIVVATADESIAKLRETEDALSQLLQSLKGENHPDAKFQLMRVIASLEGLVAMLAMGTAHLGLANDTRTLLDRFKDDHPHLYEAAKVGVAALAALLAG